VIQGVMPVISRLLATILLLASLTTSIASGAEVRTWTDRTGKFTRQASFVRIDGDSIILKAPDGKELKLPLDRLSVADQQYVKTAAAAVESADDPFQVAERDADQPTKTPFSAPPATTDVRVVVAKGVGVSVEEAKKDAYREAVRQVVGAYVEGETLTRNDELIEDKVLALSGALVQKVDVLPESVSTSDGLTRLRVRAEVKVTEVMKSLAQINVTTTAIRTSDIQGQVITLADQTEAAELALGDAKSWQNVPASFFVMNLVGQPKVLKAKDDEANVQVLLQIAPDRVKYMAFAKRLVAVLSKLEGPKGSFNIDGRNPDVDSSGMKEAKEELWKHTLLFSFGRGNGADPEIAYAFPPNDREELGGYFADMGPELMAKSQCHVYCFNQSAGGQPHGCGLKKAAEEWTAAIGRKRDERIIICLMTHANETFNRTKWEWFTCDRSLFPDGQDSPWLRSIECEVTLYGSQGKEIASDVIPLTEGFGVSCPDLKYELPVVMLAPAWVDKGDQWPQNRYSYVPQFTFPRWFELTAEEAASIKDVKCAVRPLLNKPQ